MLIRRLLTKRFKSGSQFGKTMNLIHSLSKGGAMSQHLRFRFGTQDLLTVEIGESNEFIDGQMKDVQVGKGTMLITRIDGQLHACGSACSHFGAPLSQGLLFEDRVYCPWHLASFSVKTGFPENGPMLDGIPVYKVWETGGKVFAHAPSHIKELKTAIPARTKKDPANTETHVIIGGGVSGASAAETLRQSGFSGEILMISKEEYLPYDRTLLTKGEMPMLKMHVAGAQYRNTEYFDDLEIEVKLDTLVTHVDPQAKTIETDKGETIEYSKLLVASGLTPFLPPIPGINLKGVHTIREFADVEAIRANIDNVRNVVVFGSGFIGIEAADSLNQYLGDQGSVTVVSTGNEAYEQALGPEVGKVLRELGEKSGVDFKFNADIQKLEGNDEGGISQVILGDGTVLDADLVIVGTGSTVNTQFLNGVKLDERGGLIADEYFQSESHPDIYGAGDIVSFPYFFTQERVRVEHLAEAIAIGTLAAMNMTGKQQAYRGIPFFWTRVFEMSVGYVGNTSSYDDIIIDGDLSKLNFMAFYLKEGKVVAGAGMMRGADLIMLNQAMRLNIRATVEDFTGTKLDFEGLKKKIDSVQPRCFCQKAQVLQL